MFIYIYSKSRLREAGKSASSLSRWPNWSQEPGSPSGPATRMARSPNTGAIFSCLLKCIHRELDQKAEQLFPEPVLPKATWASVAAQCPLLPTAALNHWVPQYRFQMVLYFVTAFSTSLAPMSFLLFSTICQYIWMRNLITCYQQVRFFPCLLIHFGKKKQYHKNSIEFYIALCVFPKLARAKAVHVFPKFDTKK